MVETIEYIEKLLQAVLARREWLEKEALVKLKDELRSFQMSFSALYNVLLKKKLINEDPYKQEAKIGELEIPETGVFNEAKRAEQLSIRLSNYDNQLDFLVNFYQFNVDFLNLERIKRILGIVRYIDWMHLTPDSQSVNTKAIAEIINLSKSGIDQISLSIIGESLSRLSKNTAAIIAILKNLTAYYKEAYKLNIRNAITRSMPPAEATAANIKKKIIASATPRVPFYQEFIEELIREDYSKDGASFREAVLNSLKVEEQKPKSIKPKVSYKNFLLEGTQVIGSASSTLAEIGMKLDENESILANQKKTFWNKVRELIRQMMHREPEDVVYEVQYTDPVKGIVVKEQVNYHRFRAEMDKKMRMLASMGARGAAAAKLEAMNEEQIIAVLDRTIRDTQTLHRTLGALDDYFKSAVPKESREKIKGIKPELATIKNNIVRANQLRHEYSAQKEEEEQMRRLGITLDDGAAG